jgi:ABC-type thiamine transport system substrate-binding protein
MLGKLTNFGLGGGRVIRNKRREGRQYDREIAVGLAEYRQERARTAGMVSSAAPE